MKSVVLALLSVLLQIAPFVGQDLVLCVHEDGRQEIETAQSRCCKPDPCDVTRCEPGGVTPGSGGGELHDPGDHCTDYPLDMGTAFAQGKSFRRSDVHSGAAAAPPVFHFDRDGGPLHGGGLKTTGLIRQSIAAPTHLRTQVLRC